MNKKFLKGLAALFAVAVLGVSCSNKDNTGPEGPETPQAPKVEATTVEASKITEVVKKLGLLEAKVDATGTETTARTVKFDLSSSTAGEPSKGVYSVAKVTAAAGNTPPEANDKLGNTVLAKVVKEKITASEKTRDDLKNALTAAGITVDKENIVVNVDNENNKLATLVIPFSETKYTNKKGSISIALELPANITGSVTVTFEKK